VLGDEDRMIPHGRLPAVIGGLSRGQSLLDEVAGMDEDGIQAFLPEVHRFPAPEPEPAAELGPPQRLK
jgi:hypothetical protein